jgi:hypothetical protein
MESTKLSKQRKKIDQKAAFKRRYNKLREYKRSIDINMEQFFYFPKFIGLSQYARINKSALAVYPVLCSKADFEVNKWFQLSQEHISRMTGMNIDMVSRGVNNLLGSKNYFTFNDKRIPLIEARKVTEGTRHFYQYKAGFVRKSMVESYRGLFFAFHTCIITSGVWSRLTQRAKCLYLIMRTVAKFDAQLYAEIELDEIDIASLDFDFHGDEFCNRKWDIIFAGENSLAEMCSIVKIEHTNIESVLKQLVHFGLIERIGRDFKVMLKPARAVRY